MAALRPFLALQTADHWRRCGHQATTLDPEGGVRLSWQIDGPLAHGGDFGPPPAAAGLAFDPWCRLYVSLPDQGQVQRIAVVGTDPTRAQPEPPAPIELFDRRPSIGGDFQPRSAAPPLRQPRGLAIDTDGRLFVAETGAGRVLVYDLWENRLLRVVRAPRMGANRARPLDLAWDGERIWVALDGPPGLIVFDARRTPRAVPLPEAIVSVSRIAAAPEMGAMLIVAAGTPAAQVVPLDRLDEAFSIPFATDLEFEVARSANAEPRGSHSAGMGSVTPAMVLVVARRPGEDLLRFAFGAGERLELPHLKGRGYPGGGLARSPEGRIGYWNGRSFRIAVTAALRSPKRGRLSCFGLDAGEYRNTWGRIFIDACLPAGTDLRVHFATSDEPPAAEEEEPPTEEEEETVAGVLPMLPESMAPPPDAPGQRLFPRANGRELPWTRPSAAFATYEAPVTAPVGRYLWITIDFIGDGRTSPHLYGIRVERTSHDLLRRLPALYSRDAVAADFLRRMLAGMDGMLAELTARADQRRALLDPASTPKDLLSWLACFIGLVLDRRWPEATQRRLIGEAALLFRFRGTVPGLARFLSIVTGRTVVILESFRVRGLGGAYVGGDGGLASRAILGAGFRVGGAAGVPAEGAAARTTPPADAYELHAHRFTVVIAAALSEEERAVVEHVLALHRPAHTVYELCTVDSGMRVGIGLYIGLTTVVGRSGGFGPIQLGGSRLGRGSVVGSAAAGTRAGGSRAGLDSRVG